MTNPTLERAARAAADVGAECGLQTNDGAASWEEIGVHYADIARAVLMAVMPDAPTKAMAESVAHDDEGTFEPLHDLIGFSGENKTRTVLRQAWIDGIQAILNDGEWE